MQKHMYTHVEFSFINFVPGDDPDTHMGGLKERKGFAGQRGNGEDRCVLPTKREVTTHAPCAPFRMFKNTL